MKMWLSSQGYMSYGSFGTEVSFRKNGLSAIGLLAEKKQLNYFYALKNHITRNGIDVVAFSKEKGEIWIIELKGWTKVRSDFNETIHQIFKRILAFYETCGVYQNVKFAYAFPQFRHIHEWQKKKIQ